GLPLTTDRMSASVYPGEWIVLGSAGTHGNAHVCLAGEPCPVASVLRTSRDTVRLWGELALRSPAAAPRALTGAGALRELPGSLGDLALELLDDLGHRLPHPRELPVLDLDHAEPGGGGHRRRALLLLKQPLLPEHVTRAEVGQVLPLALHLRGA